MIPNFSLRSLLDKLGKLHPNYKHLKFNQTYRLDHLLGKGGFACVYEGVRLSDGAKVAIKKIPKGNIPHMEGSVPLEVALLQQVVDVPGVVQIIECFDMGDCFAIVLENDGCYKDLFDIIVEKGKLEETLSRNLFEQVVEAVMMCHRRGVLHRDIKDENIVINTKTMQARLIDFGSGCSLRDNFYLSFEGTPLYAPPEWLENKRYRAEDITVWELGILLFDMVCGNIPFMEDRQIIEGKLEWMADVSWELRDLTERCLSHDPKERIALKDILKHPWFL